MFLTDRHVLYILRQRAKEEVSPWMHEPNDCKSASGSPIPGGFRQSDVECIYIIRVRNKEVFP